MRRGRLTLLFSFPPSKRDRIDHGFTHPCLENFRWRWWWMLNTIDWLEWERDARCEDGAASGKRFDGSIYGCERAKDPRSRLQISRRDILIPTLISSCPNPAQSMMFECPHATSLGVRSELTPRKGTTGWGLVQARVRLPVSEKQVGIFLSTYVCVLVGDTASLVYPAAGTCFFPFGSVTKIWNPNKDFLYLRSVPTYDTIHHEESRFLT